MANFVMSENKLGKGSYGIVYLGTMIIDGKNTPIAVKRMQNDEDLFTQNAKKEYDMLCSVGEHENIIKLLGFHYDKRYIYILTEIGSHGDLEKYLVKTNLSLFEKLKIMRDCADGLKFMHSRQFVHRDIKPANVIIHNSPKGGVIAKMCDFGLSRLFDPSGEKQKMSTDVGTYMYRAPELFAIDREYTADVDLFALGLLFLAVFLYKDEEKCLEPNPEIFRKSAKLAYGQRLWLAKCEHKPLSVMFTLSPRESLTEMVLKTIISSMTHLEGSNRMAISDVECLLRKIITTITNMQQKKRIEKRASSTADRQQQEHSYSEAQQEIERLKQQLEEEKALVYVQTEHISTLRSEKKKIEKQHQEEVEQLSNEKKETEKQLQIQMEPVTIRTEKGRSSTADGQQQQRSYSEAQQEIRRLKQQIEEDKALVYVRTEDNSTLHSEKIEIEKQHQEEVEQLRNENKETIKQLQIQMEGLTKSVAESMSSIFKTSSQEIISTEDMAKFVAREYYQFYSIAGPAARVALDDVTQNQEHSVRFLDNILKVSEDITKGELQKFFSSMQSFNGILGVKVDDNLEAGKVAHAGGGTRRREEFTQLIGDYMRKNYKQVDFTQHVTDKLQRDPTWRKFHLHMMKPEIQQYVKESAEITWKMAIQQPPMAFSWEGIGQSWNQRTQELAWGSADPKKARSIVMYFHYPALLHGDQLRIRGKVVLAKGPKG